MKKKTPTLKKPIAILVSRFNEDITASLLNECQKALQEGGIPEKHMTVKWTPGAYELPFAAKKMGLSKKYSAIIALGCVIKGETSHDEHVAGWAAQGLGLVSLELGIPVLFGVLTPNSEKQAWARAKPGPLNRGREVGEAALQMLGLQSPVRG